MIDLNQPISVRVNDRDRPSVPAVPRATFDVGVRTKSAVDFSNRQIAILFVALAAITSIPVLLYPWPPLSDYMNHLSRMHIIATIGSDPDLSRFYEIDWQVIPNLMMDLVVPLLDRVMSIYLAGQIYTIASFVLILSGTLALNRRLYGHWSVLPLIAFPLLYNNVFLIGTMNYVFGIGLALWALAAWISLRERSILLRFGVSALFVLALFFCHLFAVGLYGLGLLAFELYWLGAYFASSPRPLLAELRSAKSVLRLIEFCAAGLPFLPVLPLLMLSPTWNLRGSFLWEFYGKLDGLMFVIEVYSHFAAFVLTGIVAFAAGWGMRHRALKFHSFGWVLLGVGSVTYLVMPRIIFETYMADQRLPISLAFMVIACAHLNLRHQYVRTGFATVLVLLLAIRVFEVQTVWTDLARTTASFHEFGPANRPRLQSAGRLRRSGQRRRRARPAAGACRLPRHHRAVGTGDDCVHGLRQADPACAAGVSRPCRYRGRHPAESRTAGRTSRASKCPNDQLLVALDVRLRLRLRGLHRCRFHKSGSGASDGHLRRRPLRALSHQPA